jgi:tRNA-modifying protein YgfZ
MNQRWKNFLLESHAVFESDRHIVFSSAAEESHRQIYPLIGFDVLRISGKDAAKFLQGQMTLNINDIRESQGGFGAFCNPKGRVITTFLLVKHNDGFLVIMPTELQASVKKRLQMYILRSDVQISECSDEYCLIGVRYLDDSIISNAPLFTANQQENGIIAISLPKNRNLVIAETEKSFSYWSERVSKQQFQPGNSDVWRYLDIISGIPWINTQTSEEFIPQMLNLDKLGGISFNKGCYTGQEIVARTHYLGKAKREMFLAESIMPGSPEPNLAIIDDADTEVVVGRVIQAQNQKNICTMLIVLQLSDSSIHNLKLNNSDKNKISLLTL